MIEVYTNRKYLPKGLRVIKDNEAYFMRFIKLKDLDSADIRCIETIDNAKILDLNTGTIQTPFGVTGFLDLSTGTKTAINVNHFRKNNKQVNHAIDITECGQNALNMVFQIANNTGIKLVLRHFDVMGSIDANYLINGRTRVTTGIDLGIALAEESGENV